jgi:hypothetical protein
MGKSATSSPPIPDNSKTMKRVSLENGGELSESQKRHARSVKSLMMAKARTDGTLSLPLSSVEVCPRPFIKNEYLTRGTLELYERHRGLNSRDYAIRCMSIGNTFKEKPWLQQVNQAMIISQQGVKKTFNRQPHMFYAESELSLPDSARSEVTQAILSSRESTARSGNAILMA